MSKSPSPRSANGNGYNGIKSRPPSSNNSNASPLGQKRRRSNLDRASSSVSDAQSPRSNCSFAKITAIVFIIAVADVLFVWQSINASIGGEGDEPHHVGAEAGLHHLHEKKRMRHIDEHVKEVHRKTTLQSNGGVEGDKSRHKTKVITVDTNGNIVESKKPQIHVRIAKRLASAGVEVDAETAKKLPTWNDAISQYGEKPLVYGLETCESYRQAVKPEDRMVGPAGIFNTGTNLLFQLMKENCDIKEARLSKTHREPKRNGSRWQAPWGKHNPPGTHRLKHVAKMWGYQADDKTPLNQTAFFPIVMIKDPYGWMGSQCRHKYTTWWDHSRTNCPNLIEKSVTEMDIPVTAKVKYAKGWVMYESLLDIWNKFYEEYEQVTFPHLKYRFEDLLFHGEELTRMACDCVGGVMHDHFTYIEGSAKENGMPINKGAYGLVKALLQYGNPSNRLQGLTDRDRFYASRILNSHLMQKFGYVPPPLPNTTDTSINR